jgi:hypothetical protein
MFVGARHDKPRQLQARQLGAQRLEALIQNRIVPIQRCTP